MWPRDPREHTRPSEHQPSVVWGPRCPWVRMTSSYGFLESQGQLTGVRDKTVLSDGIPHVWQTLSIPCQASHLLRSCQGYTRRLQTVQPCWLLDLGKWSCSSEGLADSQEALGPDASCFSFSVPFTSQGPGTSTQRQLPDT